MKLFVLKIDNCIDIITNSSSELFVLNSESQQIAKELIESIYPNYKSEYEEIVSLRDASTKQIDTYMSWIEPEIDWFNHRKLSREEEIAYYKSAAEKYGMTPEDYYSNWDSRDNEYWYGHISEAGLRKSAETLDPGGKIFLLFSIDENPNWDMQEKLMEVASRYHLG